MPILKVIPVLDLRRGIVVHARQGRRAEYRPLESTLCKGCDPAEIARVFAQLGFKELYLADLDAIMEGKPNLTVYREITKGGELALMVDAGVNSPMTAMAIFETGASKVIVGTETLTDPRVVSLLVERFGKRIVLSLDLMKRRLLTRARELRGMEATSAALYFQGLGVAEAILLDLSRVGSNLGPDFELVEEVCDRCQLSMLAGGGVRNLADLEKLRVLGARGALVATALHSGAVRVDELREAGFL